MNKALLTHLLNSGLENGAAQEIAKSFDGTEPVSVDQNELVKAMMDIRETFEKGNTDHEEELQSAIEEAADVVDAVSKGADALLTEVREQNDALAKGMLAIAETLDVIQDAIASKDATTQEVQKSLQLVQNKVDMPVVKSMDYDAETVEHPSGATGQQAVNPQALISKALTQLENLEDVNRGHELSKAITLLESGANPVDVMNEFRLTV